MRQGEKEEEQRRGEGSEQSLRLIDWQTDFYKRQVFECWAQGVKSELLKYGDNLYK